VSSVVIRQISYRRGLVVAGHLALVVVAYYVAFCLRFDGVLVSPRTEQLWGTLPLLLVVRAMLLYRLRLFDSFAGHTTLWDLRSVAVATILGSALFTFVTEWVLKVQGFPRSLYIIDALVEIVLLGGVRLIARTYQESVASESADPSPPPRCTVRDIPVGRALATRPFSIEDLLERPRVSLDHRDLEAVVRDRHVLVTGAGGSIGSELCRQIACFAPARLVMLDRYENGLYAVEQDLVGGGRSLECIPVIADITDCSRIDSVFQLYRPNIVFHAAAHKHVPLMEANPCEAVKNNVLGTSILTQAAARFGTEQFVLISTDKAVNPSSVMGACKRIAELIICAGACDVATIFTAVRFGNVLGSNGSVVPLFLEQIRRGGPVTVTHPEVRRYFMLIPEAVELVLHAACMARGGEIFVLDMGEQVRLLDLARSLIRLLGLRPEGDIEIRFTGLRPGEKLSEELVGCGEQPEPTSYAKITRIRGGELPDRDRFLSMLASLGACVAHDDAVMTIAILRALVPTFQPTGPNALGVVPIELLGEQLECAAPESHSREERSVAVASAR
jgi:FlaA1/EpsC-like NDP-sugar epimerase